VAEGIAGCGPGRSTATRALGAEALGYAGQELLAGFVTGAGVDIHTLVFHVSPEIHYTRWGAHDFLFTTTCSSCAIPPPGLPINQNQAEFLLGITF
jgi:hypothetical protein